MQTNYRRNHKKLPSKVVPTLALEEFQLRIRKIQANFKDKIQANLDTVRTLEAEVKVLQDRKKELTDDIEKMIVGANRRAANIIQEADGTRHEVLLEVEDIRVRAKLLLAEAEAKNAAADACRRETACKMADLSREQSRLDNQIKELEHLNGLYAKIKAVEAAAEEAYAKAQQAETRAQMIFEQDKLILADIGRKTREVKQAPFYAAKKTRR
jgi:hypothetical protein